MEYSSPDEIDLPFPYAVEDNCLGYYTRKENKLEFVELCNFVRYIS